MNSQLTETPKKRLVAVASPPVIGLKKPAKFRPICRPMISPANSTALNTMRTAKPSDRPISNCCTTASSATAESSGITGIAGSVAWAQNAIRKASATRTRAGTPRCANTGSAPNSASTRRNGHSSGVIQARTWVSVKVGTVRFRQVFGGRRVDRTACPRSVS